METTQREFHAMLGHVREGTLVHMNHGQSFRIVASMDGWIVEGPNGKSKPFTSAMDLEAYIVNYQEES